MLHKKTKDGKTVKERFLRYVGINTQSVAGTGNFPSTPGQTTLLKLLREELTDLGAADVELDADAFLFATIPATDGKSVPAVGLLAHVDTSPAVSGAGVRVVCVENYGGGDIPMGEGYVLSPKMFPELLHDEGQEILCTDGTTLLGADDKAGVAEIVELAARLLSPDAPAHGEIRIGFTSDEEIGTGIRRFDIDKFGADFAYTVDGAQLGVINCENFNAANAKVTIRGTSIHPGGAKGKMVNAVLLAMELQGMLPAYQNPTSTEGREGFFHLSSLNGNVDAAVADYLIRDHDRSLFEKKKRLLESACDYLNEKYGANTVALEMQDLYYNMCDKIDPRIVDAVKSAMTASGVEPIVEPIRGGTDGAQLSYKGLPCPNICTGGHNFHGRYEYISVQAMEKVVEILERLVTSF